MTESPSLSGDAAQEPSEADVTSPDSTETVVSDLDAKDTPADSSSADGTESSDSEGAKEPTSILEAVEAATKKDKPAADSPPVETGKKDQKDKTEDGKSEDEPESDEDLPFHKHPSWKRVVTERDQYKAKVAEYEDSHQAINRLESFMTAQSLSVDEFNTLLQVGALMKNDPAKALQAMAPYYNQLLEVTGSVLPVDIQKAVDEGTISENYAAELARSRAQSALSQQRVTQIENRSNEAETSHRLNDLSSTASTWERQWSSSDPDYAKKAELVKQGLELRWRRGDVPRSDAEMREQCEAERKAVEKQLRNLLPKKLPATSGPQSGAAGTHSATPPKTLMEAMTRAVGG